MSGARHLMLPSFLFMRDRHLNLSDQNPILSGDIDIDGILWGSRHHRQ